MSGCWLADLQAAYIGLVVIVDALVSFWRPWGSSVALGFHFGGLGHLLVVLGGPGECQSPPECVK